MSSSRYRPSIGDRVQLWYRMRGLFPYHGRCGVVLIVGSLSGGPVNVLVQLDDGPAVVAPRGNVSRPQVELQGVLF